MRVFIADAFPEQYLTALSDLGLEVLYDPQASAETLPERVVGVGILIVRSTKVSRETIEAGAQLGLVLRAGAGYDTIDVGAASERGIYVANCPGKNAAAVAELAFALILALDRRVVDATVDLKSGKWNKKLYSKADGLKGKTLGIAGLGSIGMEVMARAKAFDLEVVAWSRSLDILRADELGVRRASSLHELAERSDIVSVHLAQTAQTKGLFGASFFDHMKEGAMFINTSRGGLHDEAALMRAMKSRGLRAGLDVFQAEPSGGAAEFSAEISALPGFVGTHHIGASTDQAQSAIAEEAVRVCQDYIRTGRPPNVVNIEERAPARSELVIRHYDKVGVLAQVLDAIRTFEINVAEMSNTIFQGQKAAVAAIRVETEPPPELIAKLESLKDLVIQVEVKPL